MWTTHFTEAPAGNIHLTWSPSPAERDACPEYVKTNQVQISDSKTEKVAPRKVTWLAQDDTVCFWWSLDSLRSPDPQSTPWYAFKGKNVYFILSLPRTWHAFLAFSDLTGHVTIFQEADTQHRVMQRDTLVSPSFPPSAPNDTTFKINGKPKPFKFPSSAKQHYGENIKQQGPTNYRPVFSLQRQVWFWKFAVGNILRLGSWKWTQDKEEGGEKDRWNLRSQKRTADMTGTGNHHEAQDGSPGQQNDLRF